MKLLWVFLELVASSLGSDLAWAADKSPADLASIRFEGRIPGDDGNEVALKYEGSKIDERTIHFTYMIHHFPAHACFIEGVASLQDNGKFLFTEKELNEG